MSSFAVHMTLPMLALFATGLFPRRAILMWVPFAIISDVDFIFNFIGTYTGVEMLWHRKVFHNLFIVVPTAVIAVQLWRRMMLESPHLHGTSWRTRWDTFGTVPWGYGMVLASFYLFSHVFLDMFQGGVTPLWPFINQFVHPQIYIWVDTSTGIPEPPVASVDTGVGAPALAPRYPWLTPQDFAFLVLAVLALVVSFLAESRWATEVRREKAALTATDAAPQDSAGRVLWWSRADQTSGAKEEDDGSDAQPDER